MSLYQELVAGITIVDSYPSKQEYHLHTPTDLYDLPDHSKSTLRITSSDPIVWNLFNGHQQKNSKSKAHRRFTPEGVHDIFTDLQYLTNELERYLHITTFDQFAAFIEVYKDFYYESYNINELTQFVQDETGFHFIPEADSLTALKWYYEDSLTGYISWALVDTNKLVAELDISLRETPHGTFIIG